MNQWSDYDRPPAMRPGVEGPTVRPMNERVVRWRGIDDQHSGRVFMTSTDATDQSLPLPAFAFDVPVVGCRTARLFGRDRPRNLEALLFPEPKRQTFRVRIASFLARFRRRRSYG